MKRGFTLLELIIVIIILGVLATLGFNQYGRMVERSRGAEGRAILGDIRKFAAAYRLEHSDAAGNPTVTGYSATDAGIGSSADQIPNPCRGTHYFSYAITNANGNTLTLTATRCTAGGKNPNAPAANTLTLTTDFGTGADTWGGTGGY